MKKLLYISPNPKSAVSWYRGLGALNYLRGTEVTDGSNSEQSWNTISKYDIIFLERPCRESDVFVMNYAKMLGKKVWVDFDDLAWDVPATHPQAFTYQSESIKNNIKMCIIGADVVTTTTQFLADKIKPMNKNVVVIPNALNDYVFKTFKKYNPKSNDILWRGSPHHVSDLDEFGDEIVNVIDEFKDKQFHFWGVNPFVISKYVNNPKQIHMMPLVDIMYYFQRIQDLNPKVVMVPLAKNDFNKAISNIAWIEATLAGAVTVAPTYVSSFGLLRNVKDYNPLSSSSGIPTVMPYRSEDSFEMILGASITGGVEKSYEMSVQYIQDNLLLSNVNEKRYEIVEP